MLRFLDEQHDGHVVDDRVEKGMRLLQALLGNPPVRHIPEHPLHTHDAAAGIPDGHLEDVDVVSPSVDAGNFLDVFEQLAGFDDTDIIATILFRVGPGKKVEVGPAADLVQRPAQGLAEPLVAEQQPKLPVLLEDAQRQTFDEGFVQFLSSQRNNAGIHDAAPGRSVLPGYASAGRRSTSWVVRTVCRRYRRTFWLDRTGGPDY